jgi:hypothetical protein
LTNISRIFHGQLFSIFITLHKSVPIFFIKDAGKLIHAFVTSRLNYCNALLSDYPDKALNKLQLVLNTTARILTRTKTFDHITPVLASLHWLPVKAYFKVLMLTYKALHGLAPNLSL